MSADPALEQRVGGAFSRLEEGLDPASVASEARALLAEDAGFHPAIVLEAQVAFLAGRDREAVDLLAPVTAELPEYIAAQLLLGGAAERLGDLKQALAAFRRIEERQSWAARRSAELRPRVIEILFHQLEEAGERGRPDLAAERLAELEPLLDPESQDWIDAQLLVAVIRRDLDAELELLHQMLAFEPDSRELLERMAELELEIGDLRRGLETLETLAARFADDPTLQQRVQKARFLWRLEQLPPQVQSLRKKSELDRADLAVLLYWLVPSVRFTRVNNPPIATDILDHPQREEIVRVLNLGLLGLDTNLHHFSPDAAVHRGTVFAALLALLRWADQGDPCLDGLRTTDLSRSPAVVCQRAASCGLISDAADCLPEAGLSGTETIEYFRRVLDLLGAPG